MQTGVFINMAHNFPGKFLSNKQEVLSLEFSFSIIDIYSIFKWAKSFVHSGKNALCYVIGFALTETKRIFQVDPNISGHCNYRNSINNYSALKQLLFEFVVENTHDDGKSIAWVTPTLSNIRG